MFTLTVERPAGSDRYGNPLPGSSHTIKVRAVGPRGSSDEVEGDRRAQVITDLGMYCPPGTDIRSQDVVTDPLPPIYTGKWQVQGDPGDWRYLSGRGAGIAVVLHRVEG